MNFKKRVNGSWVDTPHYIHNTSTDTITTLPAAIYANDTTATIGLKGDMVQSGTPTPTTPIQPQECGERTGNLLDWSYFEDGYYLNIATGLPDIYAPSPSRIATTSPIDVSNYNYVTFSFTTNATIPLYIYSLFNGNTLIRRVANNSNGASIDTSEGDKLYLCIYSISTNITTSNINAAMLNDGSSPFSYEPYGYKIPISSGGVNLLPEFYVSSGEISGNSYAITKNSIETHNDGSILAAYFVLTEFKMGGNYANYIPIDEKHSFKIPAGTYTFSANENTHSLYNGLCLIVGQLGKIVSEATSGAKHIRVGQTFTINEDSYVCPILEICSVVDEYILTNPMLNLGATALPYEPYVQPTETPVYFGEVESTRRIKKYEFTGTETFTYDPEWGSRFVFAFPDMKVFGLRLTPFVSTHYQSIDDGRSWQYIPDKSIYSGSDDSTYKFFIKDTTFSSVSDFANYLASQYAAGTPVTVWYILSTPTTGIVNEPLRKIGDYADTVSGVSIPTVEGANTIDVDTTLKPSEVTVTYKGWHPITDVHEAVNGQWD